MLIAIFVILVVGVASIGAVWFEALKNRDGENDG